MLRLSSVRSLAAYLFVVKRVTVFLMVSSFAISTMAEDVWVNKEGKRPWIDLPYKDWPIFKEENPKLIKKEVAYIDTGLEEKEKWRSLKWLDDHRFFIYYDNRQKAKERGGLTSTDVYDIRTKKLTSVSKRAAIIYVNKKNGIMDAVIDSADYSRNTKTVQYKEDEHGDIKLYREIDDNKKLYLYSDSANACLDAFQPPENLRYKYIDGTNCKSYFITNRVVNLGLDRLCCTNGKGLSNSVKCCDDNL